MYNFMDVQYYTDLTVGGQAITGLLDTGSFDLVVFDKRCEDCGAARKYGSSDSNTFSEGTLDQVLYYGSGSIDVRQAFDRVAIGPFDEVNLTFWDAKSAAMPVLRHAAFNAILGVGPPETPGSDAWTIVRGDVRVVQEALETGPRFPSSSIVSRVDKDTELATALSVHPTLIKADRIERFSICLGKKPGSVGYFVWNDTSQILYPPLFTWVKVIGRHTWTVNMTDMRLSPRHSDVKGDILDCWDGCGAIVDSGTSLLLMPFDAIAALRGHLRMMNVDCSNLDTLPSLTFNLGGQEFSLPPDAYIAKVTGNAMSAHEEHTVSGNFHAERVPLTFGGGDCELSVMGSSSYTNWGPLWILGMPFFRKYYTTFEVGKDYSERGLWVTPASANCTPIEPAETDLLRRPEPVQESQELRTVNMTNILIPRLAHKAMTSSHMNDL